MATLSPVQISVIVEAVFEKYDANKNDYLELGEIETMLKDSFKKMKSWRNVSDEDIKTLVGTDGNRKRQRLNRKDLGEIIRKALKL
jgi:hypothetical protein